MPWPPTPDGGGVGLEYHPWDPDNRWEAEFEWHSDHAASITVGPYVLTAARVGRSFLRGVETGPHGEHIFDVVQLADQWAPLSTFAGRSWVLFRPPPKSAAWLDVPDGFEPDRPDSILEIGSMRQGWSDTIHVRSAPGPHAPTIPLRYDTDSRERWDESESYGSGETFQLDRDRACLRSDGISMYQVLQPTGSREVVPEHHEFSNRAPDD